MTILVTGANGQLGNEMRLVAGRSSDRYIFTDVLEIPGRHDVCFALRAPVVVEAMTAIALADLVLL